MNKDLVKKALDIDPGEIIYITKVSRGFNIRTTRKYKENTSGINGKPFFKILKSAGEDPKRCRKCFAKVKKCHPHHIIPKSAGGKDDPDNGIFLCFDCHVGINGIHNGKWDILDIVHPSKYVELERRYKLL